MPQIGNNKASLLEMCKTESEDPSELPQNNNTHIKGKGGNSFPESKIENV